MKPEQFEFYLSVYGSRIERWPETAQAKAWLAIEADDDLMRRLEEEEGFEKLLIGSFPVETSPDLAARIATAAFMAKQEELHAAGHPANAAMPGFSLLAKAVPSYSKAFAGLKSLASDFGLPRPAYTLTALAILGFLISSLVDTKLEVSRSVLDTLFGAATVFL